MSYVSNRIAQSALTGVIVLGCSEGAPPTQPVAQSRAADPVPQLSADVAATSATGAIVACYIPGKALVYRIKVAGAPDECAKNDVEFTIDQGVPGPQGPGGPPGPQGGIGPQGPGGPMTGVTLHFQGVVLPADSAFRTECPPGKAIVNFGYQLELNSAVKNPQVTFNRPGVSQGKVLWIFKATPGTMYGFYWTCANSEPATVAN